MIRFALHPGTIVSVNDGDLHYVGEPQLADLYGVSLLECVTVDPDCPWLSRGIDQSVLLHLYPSHQGAAYWKISEAERRAYPLAERTHDFYVTDGVQRGRFSTLRDKIHQRFLPGRA